MLSFHRGGILPLADLLNKIEREESYTHFSLIYVGEEPPELEELPDNIYVRSKNYGRDDHEAVVQMLLNQLDIGEWVVAEGCVTSLLPGVLSSLVLSYVKPKRIQCLVFEDINALLNTLAGSHQSLVVRKVLRSSIMYIGPEDCRKSYTKRYLEDTKSRRDLGLTKDHHITVFGAANWE
jgi:hypothetical protein